MRWMVGGASVLASLYLYVEIPDYKSDSKIFSAARRGFSAA